MTLQKLISLTFPKLVEKLKSTQTPQVTVDLQITNSLKQKFHLDLIFSKKEFNGKPCFSFVFFNLNHIHEKKQLIFQNRERQKMMGVISHELRTPINGLQILLNCAKSYMNLPTQFVQKYLKPAEQCSEYLLHLINDILDYTELNFTNELSLHFERVNLRTYITQILELFQFKAKIRRLDITAMIHPNTPKFVRTDPRRLKQILINLIGNALKFTFKGYITLNIEPLGGSSGLIEFRVQDTGVGMDQKGVKKLFKMFGKVEAHREINKSGTGLGLVISNKLVKRLTSANNPKKAIQVESKLGAGTTFSFTIEDRKNKTQQKNFLDEGISKSDFFVTNFYTKPNLPGTRKMQKMTSKGGKNDCFCPKILIVDDDEFSVYALDLLLFNLGFLSEYTNNGKDALEMLRMKEHSKSCSCNYKLIFMDCNMSLMNGYETTQKIRL